MCNLAFAFFIRSYGIVHDPVKNSKTRIPNKNLFAENQQCTIHNFKNYFTTMFPVISFQFSANRQYPNTTEMEHLLLLLLNHIV